MTTFQDIAPLIEGQAIEVPSWAYGNSGTRLKVFGTPGTPRATSCTVPRVESRAQRCHRR